MTRALLATVVLATLGLGGCSGGYTLSGRVVQSSFGTLDFVPHDDPRLGETGVSSVEIRVYRDPTTLNTRQVARGVCDGAGWFSVSIDEFGAGWMVEQWRIEAYRTGFETVDRIVTLPNSSDGLQLLVTLAPGPSSRRDGDDISEQLERFR